MNISSEAPPAGLTALAVGEADLDQLRLQEIFRDRGWILEFARTSSEASAYLRRIAVPVVIAGSELDGGGWRELLESAQAHPEPPSVIVTSRLADDGLWAEVLNMGGYDVLARPLDTEEVTRVVLAAARHFDRERHRYGPGRSAAPQMARAS
jgi:DNA-binding response OmpR family regulator